MQRITLILLLTQALSSCLDKEPQDRSKVAESYIVPLRSITDNAIDHQKLQFRGKEGEKLAYAPNEQTPYTGYIKVMGDKGNFIMISHIKAGQLDGRRMIWYSNRKLAEESVFMEGKLMWAKVWKPTGKEGTPYGENCTETNVSKGNGVLVIYEENGSESLRQTYKDGIVVD